jgi:hypothetical protein
MAGSGRKKKSAGKWRLTNMPPLLVAAGLSLFVVYQLPRLDVSHGGGSDGRRSIAVGSGQEAQLLRTQNQTIVALRERLESLSQPISSSSLLHASFTDPSLMENEARLSAQLEHANGELGRMQAKLLELTSRVKTLTVASSERETGTTYSQTTQLALPSPPLPTIGIAVVGTGAVDQPRLLRTSMDENCEARFGLGLADKWRATKEEWCTPPKEIASVSEGGGATSSIHCYPYTQTHKHGGSRRSSTDLFCEGRNILIDFTKVLGEHGRTKPRLGSQYLSFSDAATQAACKPTKKFGRVSFMPHMNLQMGGGHFQSGLSKLPGESQTVRMRGSTYLLTRDEDCENMVSRQVPASRHLTPLSYSSLVFLATFARRLVGSIDRSLPEFSSTRQRTI